LPFISQAQPQDRAFAWQPQAGPQAHAGPQAQKVPQPAAGSAGDWQPQAQSAPGQFVQLQRRVFWTSMGFSFSGLWGRARLPDPRSLRPRTRGRLERFG
jgi:hypothetical protein